MTPARRALVLAALLLPLLLQGAGLPHTHVGAEGVFNQEHDLTLLAITATVGSLDAAAPALVLILVVASLVATVSGRPVCRRARAADSRAPPGR